MGNANYTKRPRPHNSFPLRHTAMRPTLHIERALLLVSAFVTMAVSARSQSAPYRRILLPRDDASTNAQLLTARNSLLDALRSDDIDRVVAALATDLHFWGKVGSNHESFRVALRGQVGDRT